METRVLQPDLHLDNYHYDLPRELIAKYPLEKRDASRMLVLDRKANTRTHRQFSDLPEFLNPGDVVVINNTKVLPVRLFGHREGFTGKVEIFLLAPENADASIWQAMLRPWKKLTPGTRVIFPGAIAEILPTDTPGIGRVAFTLEGHASVLALMDAIGEMPIPPYLSRPAESADRETYQTVFAKEPGAHAAPTAGLHFTPEVFETLKQKGVDVAEVTLNVSTGTFKSVDAENITQHVMDPEWYSMSQQTVDAIENAKASGKRVIAIGTTVAKTLETVAAKYNGKLQADTGNSQLFIYPGFQFNVVDTLLTNFHLPKTTLLMLVSALSSREQILETYREAVENRYRFFSYGDCMLIL